MLRLQRQRNESSLHETVKKEKEIWASSAGAPQSAPVTATGHDKCFTEMERALNLHSKMSSERDHVHTVIVVTVLFYY